jgi:hypothetical protein
MLLVLHGLWIWALGPPLLQPHVRSITNYIVQQQGQALERTFCLMDVFTLPSISPIFDFMILGIGTFTKGVLVVQIPYQLQHCSR